jgi:hypothetical protein
MEFEVLNYVSGNVRLGVDGGTWRSANGVYSQDIEIGTNFAIYTASANLQIDNLTVRPLSIMDYKNADSFDGFWYDGSLAMRSLTAPNLVGVDPTRTLVKYSYAYPYNIEWIGLLDASANISQLEWDQLHNYFNLHVFWSGGFSEYGVLKDNRPLQGQAYKGWITAVDYLGLQNPSDNVKLALNNLNIDLLLGGVHSGFDKFWIFMLNDASLVTGAATISFANTDSSIRLTFPVEPTYTTAGFYGDASSQYAHTHYSPHFNGINYTQNNASRIMLRHTAGSGALDGAVGGDWNSFVMSEGGLNRINGAGIGSISGNLFIGMNRSDASGGQLYLDNAVTNFTDDALVLPGYENPGSFLLQHGWGYGDSEISMYALAYFFR